MENLTEFQKGHMLTPLFKEVSVLASRMRLVDGVLWTFLNEVAFRRAFPHTWQTSAGHLWRFELILFFGMWWTAAATVLGVVNIYDLRLTLRQQVEAHLEAVSLSGEGDNV
jgi:hypothetical protein